MAKSGKAIPKSKPTKTAAIPARPATRVHDWLDRPPTEEPGNPWLPKIFWGLAAIGLIALIALSFGSGINADDKFQNDYSKKLVSYYSTFGKDTSALNVPEGNMHLYGGFFEIVTGFANKTLGYEVTDLAYHNLRHASSAVLGWVAVLCTALLVRLIAGWQAGIIALVIMLLSPRFVGDSLMNPKDIPFAAGYMMALYNMVAVLNRMPKPARWNLVGLAAGLAIALAVRAGGLLPFAYLGMFAGLHFLLKNGGLAALSNTKLLGRYAFVVLGAGAAGYLVAVFFWPYALQSPLHNPFIALSKFAELEVKIRVLYEGENIMSDKTPWHYPLKWMLYTIPLATIAGLVGYVLFLPRLLKKYNPLWVLMVLFAGIFPVAYIIAKHSVIHDGWRHLTFAYPPLVAAAALFWNELANQFADKKAIRYAVLGVMAALLLDSAAFIATNPKYPYTYFNPLIGGINGAFGQFETDYWGVSTRQGIEWLENQGILKPDMPETVVIATNMYHSVRQLTAKYGDKVKVKYLKWERRCDDAWDYALYPTRFLDGATLQRGKWPPSNAVHIVEASGVPLLAVLKDNGRNCTLGAASLKVGDWDSAISFLQKETQTVPDNDLAWSSLAQAYYNANKLEEARAAAEKALDISPDDMQASNLLGMYWLQKGDATKAKAQFEGSLKREPSNAAAFYYLALIARSQGDNQTALNDLMKAIQVAPNFKAAYELSAQIYEEAGNTSAAQQFRAAVSQIK